MTPLEFTALRNLLEVSDGNLGTHLRKLDDAGYVEMTKTFIARKPRTYVAVTSPGREAFRQHVEALKAILRHAEGELHPHNRAATAHLRGRDRTIQPPQGSNEVGEFSSGCTSKIVPNRRPPT